MYSRVGWHDSVNLKSSLPTCYTGKPLALPTYVYLWAYYSRPGWLGGPWQGGIPIPTKYNKIFRIVKPAIPPKLPGIGLIKVVGARHHGGSETVATWEASHLAFLVNLPGQFALDFCCVFSRLRYYQTTALYPLRDSLVEKGHVLRLFPFKLKYLLRTLLQERGSTRSSFQSYHRRTWDMLNLFPSKGWWAWSWISSQFQSR